MLRVSNEATVNVRQDADALVKKYEREIQELKQELSMHDAFTGGGRR
jgi:kinesin family protein 6/9